MSYILLPVLKS